MSIASHDVLILLFALAVFAGLIDTMAGGGGLLVVPGLMAAGLDPVSAFATNKFQAIFGTASATAHFWRKGRVSLKKHLLPAIVAFLSSIGGAVALTRLDPGLLKAAVPFILISIASLLLIKPDLGDVPRRALLSPFAGTLTLVPLVGLYDGFFGPGTGTFFALGAVAILGSTLEEATILAKIYNFASNLGGLLFLASDGHAVWTFGAVMALGTLIGGNLGARLVLKHGVSIIKPFVVAMSLAMSVKLLWQQGTIQEVSRFAIKKIEEAQRATKPSGASTIAKYRRPKEGG
jgi:uncharacterized protein